MDGNETNRYYGDFENAVREQFLFVYDYETKTGTLWYGDAGWKRSFQIENGHGMSAVPMSIA